jgi:putative ABC transport system permease protein
MGQQLRIALRSIIKGRYYSLVSVAGLSIAITVVLLVALLVQHETSFDRDFARADSIYRVSWENTGTGDRFATMFNIFSPQMKTDFKEVEEAARLGIFELTMQRGATAATANPAVMRYENIALVDPAFFSLFDFEFVSGSASALDQPNSIVMTQASAERYFPGENALGQTLLLENNVTLTVTGLLREIPVNSHFTAHYFVPLETLRTLYDGARFLDSWSSDVLYHYVQLAEGTSADVLEQQLPAFLERHDPEWPLGSVGITLQPLSDIHFTTDLQNDMPVRDTVRNIIKAPRQASDLVLFTAGSFFLILVASFNFMNLQIARSIGRGKQLGMLKVLGANRRQLIEQILLESVALCCIAFLFALVLVELVIGSFNHLLAVNLAGRDLLSPGLGGMALLLTLGLGLLSGAYPALLMSSQNPSQVMKGEFRLGQGAAKVRGMLVLLQFAASVILIVVSLVIYTQIQFSLDVPLGFTSRNIAVLNLDRRTRPHFETLHTRLIAVPGVESVTRSSIFPTDNLSDGMSLTTDGSQREVDMRSVWVGHGYFETLGIELTAGRTYSPEFTTDEFSFPSEENPLVESGIIINEAAARKAGWMSGEDPSPAIGKSLSAEHEINGVLTTMRYRVVGVVKDVHFRSLRSEIVPMSYYLSSFGRKVGVRFASGVDKSVAAGLVEQVWNEVVNDAPLRINWLEDSVDELYAQEHRSLKLVASIALLAIAVACLGLFAVATLVTGLRTREIGLRKILGAGIRELVNMLSWQFLKPVLLANLIAWPLAWLYLDDWLQLFAYRVELDWPHFMIPAGLAIAIAWITVAGQALRVATDNPIKALRYE